MSLKTWEKNGWLRRHKTSPREIQDLLRLVARDLSYCEATGLSADWKFNIAYNASLQIATIALATSGYRTSRTAHHFRTLQSLAFTLKLPSAQIDQLDHFRKKRNTSDYEQADLISDQEVREMASLARELRQKLLLWLKPKFPDQSFQ
jgi:hypothetical protein